MMNNITSALMVFLLVASCSEPAPKPETDTYATFMPVDHKILAEGYDQYKETDIRTRRFKHDTLHGVFGEAKRWKAAAVGQSIEGRTIFEYTIGTGPVVVLLWSQMHGDESTATMALTDIFHFFEASDELDAFREDLLSKLTIVAIPMLNPDGAERFRRRNLLDIDINRDAMRLVSPEGALLKARRDHYQAAWGFNLHDQNRYYAAGSQPLPATVSFLAPAYNEEKEVNASRGDAMRLIGIMHDVLAQYIPGQLAKYDDTFEPRAFGDNIQKWGTRTILIESGGMPGDPEKQEIRKLNYIALLSALQAIAFEAYPHKSLQTYADLPFNNSNRFFDVLVREVRVQREDQWFTVDLGFRRSEINNADATNYYYRGSLSDMGDLSTFFAYEEVAGSGMEAVAAGVHPNIFSTPAELQALDPVVLLREGIGYVRLRQKIGPMQQKGLAVLPIGETQEVPGKVNYESQNAILLRSEAGVVKVIVHGTVYDLDQDADKIRQRWAALTAL